MPTCFLSMEELRYQLKQKRIPHTQILSPSFFDGFLPINSGSHPLNSPRRYTTALAIGEGLSGSAAGVLGMLQKPGPTDLKWEDTLTTTPRWSLNHHCKYMYITYYIDI